MPTPTPPCQPTTAETTPQDHDYLLAINFARDEFATWQTAGLITPDQLQHFRNTFDAMRDQPPSSTLVSPSNCWRCSRAVAHAYAYCNRCGAPLGEQADHLRYLNFILKLIEHAPTVLDPSQAIACTTDATAHIASLRTEMEAHQLDAPSLAAAQSAEPVSTANATPNNAKPIFASSPDTQPKRRSVLEILLDPRNIQWLLGSGGGLLVVGLVIWLASLGFFKNPLTVASAMGAGTLALMAVGFATIKLTRHELAGRAITLLACLAMPLNLWFYHAHALITLDGHLWVPALICCALYATAAMVLEDPVFVYVLSAGIAMTGLLFLGDLHKLSEIASPAALLVSLGLLLLHVERAFPKTNTPFSRDRFGTACFRCAHALLGLGLILLMGAQLGAVLNHLLPIAPNWLPANCTAISTIVTDPAQRLLALALVLAAAYAYVYSDLVVQRNGRYLQFAAAALLWAGALGIHIAHLFTQPCAFIAALALASLLANVFQSISDSRTPSVSNSELGRPLARLALVMAVAAALIGALLQARSTQIGIFFDASYTVSWNFAAALAFSATCASISAYLVARRGSATTAPYLMIAGACTLISSAALLTLLGFHGWAMQSAVLMVIPTAFLVASQLFRDQPLQRPLAKIAHAGTLLLIASALASSAQRLLPFSITGTSASDLQTALLLAEAAAFYIASALLTGGTFSVYLAAATTCAALGQLLGHFNFAAEIHGIAFAILGIILLITDRLAGLETSTSPLARPIIRTANALISLSAISMALIAMSKIAVGSVSVPLAISLAIFIALPLVSAALVRTAGLRRWYIATAIGQFLLTCITIEQQSQLTLWQNLEIFTVAIGLLMLLAGYALWFAEQDHHSDAASFCLGLGSILATLPLAIAAVIYRFSSDISLVNEFALATICIMIFVTGFMCRLRAPTLVGASLLALHLAMLLISAGMRAQLAVGIYLAVGGAALFATGLLLSIHRDRLLAMPQKIREHEGIFQVLTWR